MTSRSSAGRTRRSVRCIASCPTQGVLVPNGFAITADAYRYMLEAAGALQPLRDALEGLKEDDVADLARRARRAREIVYDAGLPDDLVGEIVDRRTQRLQDEYGEDVSLAVRSSATAEDLPTASFAGQQETYLNIRGTGSLLDAVPAVLREPVHRPRDPLPDRSGIRSLRGRAVDRRDEDGALRYLRLRRCSSRSTRSRGSATSCS